MCLAVGPWLAQACRAQDAPQPQTPVTITVQPGARQTFRGGAQPGRDVGVSNFTSDLFTRANTPSWDREQGSTAWRSGFRPNVDHEVAVWNHDDTVRRNVLADNRDA